MINIDYYFVINDVKFILSYFIIKGYIANVCVCIMFLNENDLLLTVMWEWLVKLSENDR